MKPDLKGKTALVTGASCGLGAAIATHLGICGARVAVNYHRNHEGAASVVNAIEAEGGEARAYCYDATEDEAIRTLMAAIRNDFGPPNIFVNNAVGDQPFLSIEDLTWDHFLKHFTYFIKSPLLIVQDVLGEMKRRRWGRIIHIGSEVVELGNEQYSDYVTAKAAMVGLTRSWARELGPWGITVNLVAPGWIPLPRHQDWDPEEFISYAKGVPLKRQGVPQDVAEAVGFLASDEANFITGQKLTVNGGNTFA